MNKIIISLTGVYFVAAKLSEIGYITDLTTRNMPNVDILAAKPDGNKSYSIQVKANYAPRSYWLFGKRAKVSSPSLFYVFVNLKENKLPDFYIVKSKDVVKKQKLRKFGKKKQTWYWFELNSKDKDRWDLLK